MPAYFVTALIVWVWVAGAQATAPFNTKPKHHYAIREGFKKHYQYDEV